MITLSPAAVTPVSTFGCTAAFAHVSYGEVLLPFGDTYLVAPNEIDHIAHVSKMVRINLLTAPPPTVPIPSSLVLKTPFE